MEYSFRISNEIGLGHLSCFVVVCKVEQNCEVDEINFKLQQQQKTNSSFPNWLSKLTW